MKTTKKNRFFTFIWSCMPGAGEMYMGFMNRGVSMMLLFIMTIVVSIWIAQAAIMALCVVEWFFSFFYVNHLASLSDEEFAKVEDKSILGLAGLQMSEAEGLVHKYNKVIACILIFLGGCFLWNTFAEIVSWILPEQFKIISRTMRVIGNCLPSIAIGFGIIFLGIKMLEGKKVEIVSSGQLKEDKTVKEDITFKESVASEGAQEDVNGEKFENFSKTDEVKGPNASGGMQDSEEKQEEKREGM
ncbi:hypothetical protein [Parablautia muri]|uniref:Uncharacterized protein n=1 Tax=Parablautia muri TaxID=2320879 RepID=A0A9X5BJL8_9FIRM|nr:hypothetical protein [Parablautia muri]NBJ94919.1 hypothetical protein [Parablautia muri]